MKIIQVAPSIDLESGGPSYTVTRLASELNRLHGNVQLHTLHSNNEKIETDIEPIFHLALKIKKIGMSPSLLKGLYSTAERSDVLHSHGLWMMPNIYPGRVAREKGCVLVISPRGMLANWSLNRSKYKKIVMGYAGQYRTLRSASGFHVTAISELEDIRGHGLTQPAAVIPNGVDIPDIDECKVPFSDRKRVLFLSRIHPKKGLNILMDAWKVLAETYPKWELIICGPGERQYVQDAIRSIQIMRHQNVHYREPVYGREKYELFRSSDLLVLPTENENFGVVVAEALAHRVPVIVSHGAPWEGVQTNRCGWWIHNNCKTWTETLMTAMAMSDEARREMGIRGRQWVTNTLSWNVIATQMLQFYTWLRDGGTRSNFVFLS